MKKISTLTFLALLLSLAAIAPVHAQSVNSNTNAQAKAQADISLPDVSVLPDSAFYGIKIAWEKFVDVFVTGKAQIKRDLRLAEKRVAEIKASAQAESDTALEKAASLGEARFEAAMDLYEKKKADFSDEERAELLASIQASVSKHLDVLASVMVKASVNAQAGLQTAIDNSSKVIQRFEQIKTEARADLNDASFEVKELLDDLPVIDVDVRAETEESMESDGSMESDDEMEEDDAGVMIESETELDSELNADNTNVDVGVKGKSSADISL